MEDSKNENQYSIKKLYKILIFLISIFLLVSVVRNYRLKADVHNLIQNDLKELKDVLEFSIKEIEEFEQMDEKKWIMSWQKVYIGTLTKYVTI